MAERLVTTYSIVACDLDARRWGVATQSKFLGVGSIVPWAEAEVGAIATQSYANPRYGPDGLALLRDGLSADDVVERLTSADDGREHRQVGVVDARGGSATFAGGDSRGQQSAALLVVEKDGGYAGLWDVVFDLRVDDHPRPLEDLRRLHGLHVQLFGETPRDEWLPVGAELAAELRDRLARVGFEDELEKALPAWAGQENLEERVDGVDAIDPVVLEELRRQS